MPRLLSSPAATGLVTSCHLLPGSWFHQKSCWLCHQPGAARRSSLHHTAMCRTEAEDRRSSGTQASTSAAFDGQAKVRQRSEGGLASLPRPDVRAELPQPGRRARPHHDDIKLLALGVGVWLCVSLEPPSGFGDAVNAQRMQAGRSPVSARSRAVDLLSLPCGTLSSRLYSGSE